MRSPWLSQLHVEKMVRGEAAALIPYRFPDLPDLYYLGFCHGPAGTARTSYEPHRLMGEREYSSLYGCGGGKQDGERLGSSRSTRANSCISNAASVARSCWGS